MTRAFGYKTVWLAVRADDDRAVAEALELERVERMGWSEGLRLAGDRLEGAVLVTPPVDGWTLVVCAEDPFDPAVVSARFPEVQRFVSHRVVDLHGWQRWVDGRPVRRFEYLGESDEVLFDDGEPTEVEESEDLEFPDEETVMTIAAAWSVDPTTLDERDDLPDEVLVGRVRR